MIITLIQALYDPRISMPQEMEFYEKALEDIEFFDISPQIYWLLKQRGQLEKQTPSFFQERLKQKYNGALYQNIFIQSQTKMALEKLEEAGIQTIPLKGTFFAEKYFGHLGARCTSDIDLLVHPFDLERAINCVKSLGYIEQERIPSHFHWSFSKPIPDSPIPLTIELHWDLMKEKTSDLNMDEFWEQATARGSYRYIKELSDYHTFYMICLHGWRHNLCSLKYFLDIIQMIHILQDKIDYTCLQKDAAAHKTLRRTVRTLAIVYHYFPHLAAIKELPVKKGIKLWWNYNAIRDRNNKTYMQYVNWVYYEFFDFDSMKHTWAALVDFTYSIGNMRFWQKIKKM